LHFTFVLQQQQDDDLSYNAYSKSSSIYPFFGICLAFLHTGKFTPELCVYQEG